MLRLRRRRRRRLLRGLLLLLLPSMLLLLLLLHKRCLLCLRKRRLLRGGRLLRHLLRKLLRVRIGEARRWHRLLLVQSGLARHDRRLVVLLRIALNRHRRGWIASLYTRTRRRRECAAVRAAVGGQPRDTVAAVSGGGPQAAWGQPVRDCWRRGDWGVPRRRGLCLVGLRLVGLLLDGRVGLRWHG